MYLLLCIFCDSVCWVFLGYNVFVSFEGAFVVRQWGSNDEAVGIFWDTPKFGDIPLGPANLPSPGLLGFVTSGLSNLQRGISFVFQGSCCLHYLKILKLVPFFYLFACRMARGQKETSTSQAGRKKGTPLETPTASSLVAAMSVKELRSFSQVPTDISLELSNGTTASTIGGANNVVYFTREQFATGLRFPIPSLVNRFLHFTRAPPAVIHPNFFRIVMGCNVLNFLCQLGISLVEICFIYTLKLGVGGHLSMSAHIPRLQFVTGLLDSPKTKAKEVVLVKGLWYETPSSLGLPFKSISHVPKFVSA